MSVDRENWTDAAVYPQVRIAAYPLDEAVQMECLQANQIEFKLENTIGTTSPMLFEGVRRDDYFRFHTRGDATFHMPSQTFGYWRKTSFPPPPNSVCSWYNKNLSDLPYQPGKYTPLIRALVIFNPKLLASDAGLREIEMNETNSGQMAIYERKMCNELFTHFHCELSPMVPHNEVSTGRWQYAPLRRAELENHEMIDVLNQAGERIYTLEVLRIASGKVIVLPIAFFTYKSKERSSLRLNLMPHAPYPLFNLDLLAKWPKAKVILTDLFELSLLRENSNEQCVVAAFYGGEDALELTEFSGVFQREVSWLLLRRPDDTNEDWMYSLALKIAALLHNHGVTLNFFRSRNLKIWNSGEMFSMRYANTPEWDELALPDVIAEAKRRKLHVPEVLDNGEEEILLDWNDIENVEPLRFIMTPLISENSLNLISSGPGVGKTFFCHTLAAAFARGNTALWDGRWKTTEPQTVLYLDGEMMSTEMKRRVISLKKILDIDEKVSQNLIVYPLLDNAMKRSREFNLAADYALADIQKYIDRAEKATKRKVSTDIP